MSNAKINFSALDVKGARKFGVTLGLALFFWGWLLLRHENFFGHNLFAAGYVVLLLALVFPLILVPMHKVFMLLGAFVGFIFTGVILTGFFYLVVTPIALIAKLVGKKFIQKDFKEKKPTYWKDTQVIEIDKDSYRKQY